MSLRLIPEFLIKIELEVYLELNLITMK
jgi:hypothetical protein